MLKLRIITAICLGLLLLGVLFLAPPIWTLVSFGFLIGLGAWEWAGLGGLNDSRSRFAYSAVITLLMWAGWAWTRQPEHRQVLLALACCWWFGAFFWLTLAPDRQRSGLILVSGVLALVPTFIAIAAVRTSPAGSVRGSSAVLWLLALVFSADIGAFFAGRAFGRIKLAPRVSPSKTWEGVLGGIGLGLVMAWIGALWFALPTLPCLAFGLAVVIISIVGDLTESMFKRAAGIKDSGSLLPGHGGVLDRIDSITAAAPLFALGLYVTGAMA